MYPRIMQSLVAGSGVLAAGATIITTSHVRDILIPVQTADMTAAQHGETEAATQTWAAQSQLTLETFRQDGFFIVTQELAKAAEYDLQGYLADCAGRALSAKVAESVATDDGSSKPNGLAQCGGGGQDLCRADHGRLRTSSSTCTRRSRCRTAGSARSSSRMVSTG